MGSIAFASIILRNSFASFHTPTRPLQHAVNRTALTTRVVSNGAQITLPNAVLTAHSHFCRYAAVNSQFGLFHPVRHPVRKHRGDRSRNSWSLSGSIAPCVELGPVVTRRVRRGHGHRHGKASMQEPFWHH